MEDVKSEKRYLLIAVGPLRMTRTIMAVNVALFMAIILAIGSVLPRAAPDSSLAGKILSSQSITFLGTLLLGVAICHVIEKNPLSGISSNAKMWVVAFLAGHFGAQVFPLLFLP